MIMIFFFWLVSDGWIDGLFLGINFFCASFCINNMYVYRSGSFSSLFFNQQQIVDRQEFDYQGYLMVQDELDHYYCDSRDEEDEEFQTRGWVNAMVVEMVFGNYYSWGSVMRMAFQKVGDVGVGCGEQPGLDENFAVGGQAREMDMERLVQLVVGAVAVANVASAEIEDETDWDWGPSETKILAGVQEYQVQPMELVVQMGQIRSGWNSVGIHSIEWAQCS